MLLVKDGTKIVWGLKDAHKSSLQQFKRMNLKHIRTLWKLFPGYSDGISIDIFVKK